MEIRSFQNPRIKLVASLRDKKTRDETSLFIIEGFREISRRGNYKIETLFICRELFLGKNEEELIKSIGCEIIECPSFIFEKISYRDRPDGLLAIAEQKQFFLKDIKFKEKPFVLVAEGLEKPGNLGSILRSADGVGVDVVIVVDPKTDIFNPNVVRSSVGTLFNLPVVVTTCEETFSYLKEQGIKIVAATPYGAENYSDAKLDEAIALVVGSEQYGLTEIWMKRADMKVVIPMQGVADSLNVSSAATILMYEAFRQRHSVFR